MRKLAAMGGLGRMLASALGPGVKYNPELSRRNKQYYIEAARPNKYVSVAEMKRAAKKRKNTRARNKK